jgi:hypothetical protein
MQRLLLCSLLLLTHANSAAAQDLSPAQLKHWAWKPPVRLTPPTVKDRTWAKNPLDVFILARLEAAGLTPAHFAGREALLRRASFDLLGLPATTEEIDAFVNDRSADAWEKAVDRLLASPHYGERWGRHWLDLARYADSNGYEFDEARPNAWRYRDYVIASLNADKPYDRFIEEQLAGDELYPDDPAARTATGFNLLGPDMTDSSDAAQRRQNTLNDMTDTAALAFLGLTLGCARCHDHKFEPLLQSDYYRLQAFFTPAVFRRDLPVSTAANQAAHEKAAAAYTLRIKPVQDEIDRFEAPERKKLFDAKLAKLSAEAQEAHRTPPEKRNGGQQELVAETARRVVVTEAEIVKALSDEEKTKLKALQEKLKTFDSSKPPPPPTAMGLQDDAKAVKTYILERGELKNRGDEVLPGFPLVFTGGKATAAKVAPPRSGTTGRRAALAGWIASKDNPLTARVIVNRLWQHHFGQGLVRTASDFGLRGEPPTHPELLDWLAVEFVERGWSLKAMHRLMLTSATYQQATRTTPAARAKDPDNLLLSRMNRIRLEGEVVRDALLAISGRLNDAAGGPGVFPPLAAEDVPGAKVWTVSADPRDHVRRSVYIFARRNLRYPFLEAFDLPDSNLSCPRRERSTTATQSLALLNAGVVRECAEALAKRLTSETKSTTEQVERAYRLILGRRPSAKETDLATEFLKESPLRELCRALFNLNEFVYLD